VRAPPGLTGAVREPRDSLPIHVQPDPTGEQGAREGMFGEALQSRLAYLSGVLPGGAQQLRSRAVRARGS